MLSPEKLTPISDVLLDKVDQGAVLFNTDTAPIKISAFAPGILRFKLGNESRPDYGLLVENTRHYSLEVIENEEFYTLSFGDLKLDIYRSPFQIKLHDQNASVVTSPTDAHFRRQFRIPPLAKTDQGWMLALELRSGEAVYGLGEKYGPLNRRGQLVESYNHDALGVNAEISYKNSPFAWSTEGWGIWINTPARVVHGVGFPNWSHRTYVCEIQEKSTEFFLFTGETPVDILQQYYTLTGLPEIPPHWSYGTWLSKAYYRTADEALEAAKTIREKQIPCDVLNLDGRAWLDTKTRFAFEWDPSRYPDPKNFTDKVKKLGFKICVWEYPLVSIHHSLFKKLDENGWLLKDQKGETYIYNWDPAPFGEVLTPLPPSGMVDFTNPDAYAWYRDSHKALFESGVDIIKTDFGEQIPEDAIGFNGDTGSRLHNINALLYNRCVYEATRSFYGQDAMVWGRSGWAGSHRYPIQWGGDPQSDWEGLAGSIRGGLSWGLSGVPFFSHDTGGFYGEQPVEKLFVRWTQASVLSSHFRFHGIGPREPWHFPQQEALIKKWVEFRYQLIPYLKAAANVVKKGYPVMRAMPLAFPNDPAAWAFDEQYLLGEALLVAPVIREDDQKRVYLPKGDWYDYWTGKLFSGCQVLELISSLEQCPLFVKAGTILPLGPIVQHTNEIKPDQSITQLKIFGLSNSDFDLSWYGMSISEKGTGEVEIHGVNDNINIELIGNIKQSERTSCELSLKAD
jgi:alpha-D-xyloside xylohydrolase